MCEVKDRLDGLYWMFRDKVIDNGLESAVYAQCSLEVNKVERNHFESCVECQERKKELDSYSPFLEGIDGTTDPDV